MDRLWIELERAPEHDDGDTLAYWWAWGYLRQGCIGEGLLIRRPSGSITRPGDDPYRGDGATPAMCLLATHVRQTGELPPWLTWVEPEIREPQPLRREVQNIRRPAGGGLGLGNLGERARRSSH